MKAGAICYKIYEVSSTSLEKRCYVPILCGAGASGPETNPKQCLEIFKKKNAMARPFPGKGDVSDVDGIGILM